MFTSSRRRFLGVAGALGVAGLSGGLLAGCGSGGGGGAAPKVGTTELQLPKYIPNPKVKPDLPAIEPAGVTGYLEYPSERFSTVDEPPLTSGEMITALLPISNQPPVPRSENLVWQNAEKQLGGPVDIIMITGSDYRQRFNTTIAGGDIPELVFFQPIAGYNQLLTTTFEDLTPHLAGDAISKYPNLAAIPPALWEAVAKGGRIYGLPIARNGMQGLGNYHSEMFEEAGGYPTSVEEYLELLRDLTNPAKRRWGMVAHSRGGYNMSQFLQFLGAPLNWRQESDGSLTNVVETDEYAEAVEIVAKLFADGVFHPDTGAPNAKVKAIFNRGEAAVDGGTVTALLGAVREMSAIDKSFKPQALVPFEGSKGVAWMDFLSKQMTCVRKGDKERVEEILRLCNYLAAPLGADEDLTLSYGKEGTTYDFVDGLPKVREEFESHASIPWSAITRAPFTFFNDRYPATVEPRYNGTKELSKFLVKDPCSQAYSTTDAEKGATLSQLVADVTNDIISGRRKMADLEPTIEEWRSSGGNKMRDEYAAEIGA